jgi:hypothetical protein
MFAGVVVLAFGAVMLQRYFAPPALLTETGNLGLAAAEFIEQTAAPGAAREFNAEPEISTVTAGGNPRVAARAPGTGMPSEVAAPVLAEPLRLDPPALPAPPDSREEIADPVSAPETIQNADPIHPEIVAVPSRDGVIPIIPGDPAYAAARKELDIFLAECANNRDWWEVTTRIHNNAELDNPALWGLRDIELAISRAQRSYDREFANRLQARVRQYVY